MARGYLSLVLHAHLPFVHHPESNNYIEERWLFEAITETYIPLLDVFEGLERDDVHFRMTMSLTPPLLSMLASPLLQKRYTDYLNNLISLAHRECERTENRPELHRLARMYKDKFIHTLKRFIGDYEGNIITGFRRLQDSGCLELITSSATHAFLPFVKTEQALRSQIENAVRIHTEMLGRAPKGIWLPECGYFEGLDRFLKDYGIEFFYTDTHGVLHARPNPVHGVYAPISTPHGLAAFARDHETSKQVWSAQEGYPGDYDYREYYRDIGYDHDYEEIRPFLHKSGVRLNTGIKYYRITGNGDHKELYHPEWAREKAAVHAGNFMFNREKQVENLSGRMDRLPIVVASYDAELFGHWWYEGPMWIDYLCRKIHYDQQTIRMITPSEYLKLYPFNQQCTLSFSSWGRAGYGEVWLGQYNQWIYRHLHKMEERMIELADRYPDARGARKRALNQAARELLLAQSSDWAFIMDCRTMDEYAVRRTKNHIGRFNRLYHELIQDRIETKWLREVERRDAICPEIDYRTYRSYPIGTSADATISRPQETRFKVVMLSWEFPPMTVGGLSRHVFDLSRRLVRQGIEIHVVTSHVEGYPAYEINQGIHVHRVRAYQSNDMSFMEWICQLNMAMADYTDSLIRHYGPFQLIHAHDWLVGQAAKRLKAAFGLPLVATIHATEHGRNHGLFTELHHTIHQREWQLTYEAWRVIVCSNSMADEVQRIFQLPSDKLDIIPNGVDAGIFRSLEYDPGLLQRYAMPHEQIVMFVGRLVHEKGVQVLLDSIPDVLAASPDAKFIIGGKGPMLSELQEKARRMGIESKVCFAGYIDDDTRNKLLRICSVAVFPSLYEPFGIVALEAMAAGAPIIVSGVGGFQEIIEHGKDGFTVLPGDTASLSTHIIKLLQSKPLAESMAAEAMAKVNTTYNWDRIGEQTMAVYSRVASRDSLALYRERELAAAREM